MTITTIPADPEAGGVTATIATGFRTVTIAGATVTDIKDGDWIMIGTAPIAFLSGTFTGTTVQLKQSWPHAAQTTVACTIYRGSRDRLDPVNQAQNVLDLYTFLNSTYAGLVNAGGRLSSAGKVITAWSGITESGPVYHSGTVADAPETGAHYGYAYVQDSSNMVLFAYSGAAAPGSVKKWMRIKGNGTWGSWLLLQTTQSEQDTRYLVTKTASVVNGVNTGYLRIPTVGIQICWGTLVAVTNGSGDATITFPAAFASVPALLGVNGEPAINTRIDTNTASCTASAGVLRAPGSLSSNTRFIYVAIGVY